MGEIGPVRRRYEVLPDPVDLRELLEPRPANTGPAQSGEARPTRDTQRAQGGEDG
jgi:hypothetical protein